MSLFEESKFEFWRIIFIIFNDLFSTVIERIDFESIERFISNFNEFKIFSNYLPFDRSIKIETAFFKKMKQKHISIK